MTIETVSGEVIEAMPSALATVVRDNQTPCVSDARGNNVSKNKDRLVLVTTSHRGVFAGYTCDDLEEIVTRKTVMLRGARMAIYWPVENKGVLGLASDGPKKGARIGPAVTISLNDITGAVECTSVAEKAWEVAPWN